MTDQQIDEFLEILAKSPTSARDMVRGLFAAHEAKAAPAVPQGFATLNEWFLSLPEQRQAQLREDKWMLAGAAFEAGQAPAPAVPQGITADENPLMALSDCINILESPKQLNDSVRVWACVQNAKAAMKLLAATPAAPSQPVTLTDEEIDKAILEPLNALLDHIYEHTTLSEGILPLARKIARAIIAALREKEQYPVTDDVAENAARYVWLRDVHIGDNPEFINLEPHIGGLDGAIDARRGKQAKATP